MSRPSSNYLNELSWEEKAVTNPLYAVMSVEEFVDSTVPTKEELNRFYRDGVKKASSLIKPWMIECNASTNTKVLEFGCGMGRLAHGVSQFHPSEHVFGIDISETMIDYARKQMELANNYQSIGRNGEFPFETGKFDLVYSYAVFQHIATRSVVEKSISEIARVLKVGGKVKLQFWMASNPRFESKLWRDSYAFDRYSLLYGWKKVFGVPVFGVKILKSNHWGGIRIGYQQLTTMFRRFGIHIYGISHELPKRGYVWLYGQRITN